MTDSMKFGPEWLRTGGSGGGGGGSTTLSTPRYQLAEHRYGREEMLALFDRNYKPPEALTTFTSLYVEKTQLPLALVQMTEDETRMWNGITNIGSRGRGSSVDRGRGRTGRGGLYSSHYSRGIGFGDDSGDGIRIEGQSFQGRNRPFDRSQSERGWPERNGASDPGEWNGSTSPRKELSRGTSGSSLMESNWRRHRGGGEDDDGWRKWGRSSWREGGNIDRDRLDRNDGDGEESRGGGPGRWEHRGNHRPSHDSGHHPPPRTARAWESNHHDNHDNLPEWATENPSESGGSFDASGAFHGGMYSDDDEDGVAGASQQGRTRRVSEGSASNIVKSSNKTLTFGTGSVQSLNRHTNNTVGTLSKERSKPPTLDSLEDKDNSIGKERRCNSPTAKPPPSVAPTTESIPAKTLTTPSDLLQKKTVVGSAKANKVETGEKPGEPPSGPHDKENTQTQEVKKEPQITATAINRQVPLEQSKLVHNPGTASIRQRTEDDFDRMKEEADALVAKLMADEESHKEKTIATGVPSGISGNQTSAVSATGNQEKWFYRDPQGEVQGPFLASEMAEWCKAGYFTTGLLVRRTCDERYATLGDLIKMCGRVPFTPGPPIPPLKLSEQVIPPVPTTVPAGLAASAIPKSGIEDPILMMTYQQMQMLHNQMLFRQMRTSAIAKLSQSEHWTTLSPIEQNQLILQCVIQDGMQEIPEVPISTNPFVPHLASQTTNPVMQLFTQMQQAKTQPETHLPTNPHATASSHPAAVDPIQQLIQQMGGIQNLPAMQQPNIAPTPAPTQEDNPIKILLRQLNTNGHPQAPHMDTVWPQPPPQMAPQFNAQNWLAQVGPIPAMPPGQLPGSLWDLHAKDMKTEQQILEEQNLKLQEDRKKEELKKQEELQRQAEEENAKRKQKEEQARQVEEAKRKDEERKRKEEEKKRKEEERRKLEEEQKKKEEKKRKEEEKRREEKRKQEEENLKRKQEEERRKREELKKQEEKLKKEEEKRKRLEEEQKKEEERLRKEAEIRRQAEAEEQARRAEQRRREAEALRKLQERNKAPWAQTPRAMASAAHTASLAEIQRFEREKKAEEQRLQQLMQQQLAQQKAIEAAQEASVTDSSKRLQFKWAEKAIAASKPLQVKSLAQIQQEEQEHIAKQQERERQEKAGQKESASMLQNAGIWGTASQCLNWANSSTSTSQAWSTNSGSSGFWDDPAPVKSSATMKPPAVKQAATAKSNTLSQQQQLQQNSNNKASKSKNKREEELVKKLFEQNTAKTDEFTQWCNKALNGIQASVDIPTFVGFLRDIESAYEVKEYVRDYLGDTKQSTEFAKQFLEKRSKWRSAQRPQAQADDLCKPAPAINPNAPAEFQEVKGKSKKPKKGKMFKVDNRILGFSVTAAPDRINVGDRDYGEGV